MNFNAIMFGIKEWFVESKCFVLEVNVDECTLVERQKLGTRTSIDTVTPPSDSSA